MAILDKKRHFIKLKNISNGQAIGVMYSTGVKLVLVVQPGNLVHNPEEHHQVQLQQASQLKP